jgi:Camelysin metallo-endopeptidase
MDHMVIEHQIERRRKRRRGIIALLSALAALTLGAGSFSLAQFTDSDTSTWSFTAGSIDIETEVTVGAAVTGIMPGDSVTEDLVVTNAGTEELRYAMTTVATTALGDELDLEVRDDDVDGGCDDFDGGVIVAAGTTLDGAAFGSSAQGLDAGDRVLAGGISETLCFRATLPLNADTLVQGLTSAVTFTFDAEQTVNNP